MHIGWWSSGSSPTDDAPENLGQYELLICLYNAECVLVISEYEDILII